MNRSVMGQLLAAHYQSSTSTAGNQTTICKPHVGLKTFARAVSKRGSCRV